MPSVLNLRSQLTAKLKMSLIKEILTSFIIHWIYTAAQAAVLMSGMITIREEEWRWEIELCSTNRVLDRFLSWNYRPEFNQLQPLYVQTPYSRPGSFFKFITHNYTCQLQDCLSSDARKEKKTVGIQLKEGRMCIIRSTTSQPTDTTAVVHTVIQYY